MPIIGGSMRNPRRFRFLVGACIAAGAAGLALAQEDRARTSDVETTVRFLASPELAGRAADEPGGEAAAAYIAARLAALGWQPAGDATADGATFQQLVPAVRAHFAADDSFVSATWPAPEEPDGTRSVRIPLAENGLRCIFDRAQTFEAEGEVLFAGFGIEAKEYGRDDYAGADPRGKFVIVFSGEPGEQDPQSRWNGAKPTRYSSIAAKRALAASKGALALLVLRNPAGRAKSTDDLAGGARPAVETWMGAPDALPAIPAVLLESDWVLRLLEGSGIDLGAVAAEAEAGSTTARTFAGRRLSLRIAVRDRQEKTLRNVVARLGAGSGLDGEAILLGAHWDHLGRKNGALHPGADDNATGIAALLEVAKELKADPPRGKREVLLAAWTAEEEGLLGSTYFTKHPPLPLPRLATAINLDMLGRNNMDKAENAHVLQVIYSAGAPVLRDVAAAANTGIGFDLRFHPSLRFRPISDHYAFHQAGVPIVYPFSGYHADYHAASDTADKVLYPRILDAARYVAKLIRGLAAHEGTIRLDPSIKEAPAADKFETPYGG